MLILLWGFVFSWLSTLVIIRFNHVHARFSADHDLDGVQKFHAKSTPRVGGVGVMFGLCAALMASFFLPSPHRLFGLLLICAIPAFAGGLTEDLTKKVGVIHRLLLTAASAGLGVYLLNAKLDSVDFLVLDMLLAFPVVAIFFTCFAVAGVANSINLIDGYNGLASMVSIIIFLALAYVGFQVGDALVWTAALAMAGSVLGFFVWNYPRGHIFLGDGGAYLIGFMIGELSVLLLVRNPQVSCWFPLLLVLYPVFETLFTIYRRVVIRKTSPGLPDAVHMHQMIYMRLIRWAVGSKCANDKTMRNSMTSPYLWALCLFTVVPAVLFWENQLLLQVFVFSFVFVYVLLYRALVRFRAPHLFVRRSKPLLRWNGNDSGK